MEPTKELSTKKLYLKRSMHFIKRAYKEAHDENHDIVRQQFTTYKFGENEVVGLSLLNTSIWACKNWANTISQESWRSYRAALKFMSEIYFNGGEIDESTFERINTVLDNTKGVNRKDLELRTSAKKQKYLPIKDLKKIDNTLSQSKSVWSIPTRLWLRAGILTGLRPIEWRTTEINESDENIFLIVVNAKNSNDRANGEKRTLSLNHLNKNELDIVKNHLKVVNKFNKKRNDWVGYYQGCSNLLRNKNKIIFPNRKKVPTLYSSRHQFSANVKASGCTPEEIAALMGHASDLTAQMTYGKKINGTKGRKPEVEKEEVKSVRNHTKTSKYFSIKKELGKISGNKSKK